MNALIILARLNSTRLPGKALKSLGDGTLLDCVIKRAKNIEGSRVILATSDETHDDPLAMLAESRGILCHRGSLKNIASRVADCLKAFSVTAFARVNGDSPFLRRKLMKRGFEMMQEHKLDFVTNLLPRSYPYGIAVEIFDTAVFLKSIHNFNAEDREHITSYFYRNESDFNYRNIVSKNNYDPTVKLTIDDNETYRIISKMFEIDPHIQSKSLDDILVLRERIVSRLS